MANGTTKNRVFQSDKTENEQEIRCQKNLVFHNKEMIEIVLEQSK